jgi:hypothetical protein
LLKHGVEKIMHSSSLQIEYLPYSDLILRAWEEGNYDFLKSSTASNYIKDILLRKAKARQGRRFFGEAYIASKFRMRDGWYNSYKWLTAPKWVSGNGLRPQFEKPFHKALVEHLGQSILANLQDKSISMFRNHKREFYDGGKYKKPVAPDLLLVTLDGKLKFIESKLEHDRIKPTQLAGLALIKKYGGRKKELSISIVNVYPKGSERPEDKNILDMFSHFYELA